MKNIASHVSDTWLIYSGAMVCSIARAHPHHTRTCMHCYSDWRAHAQEYNIITCFAVGCRACGLCHLSVSSCNIPVSVELVSCHSPVPETTVQQFIKEVGPHIFHWGKRPGKRRPQCKSVEQALGRVFQMEPEPGLLERLQRTSCNLERCRCQLWLVTPPFAPV